MKTYLSLIFLITHILGCSDNPGIVELDGNPGTIEFVTTNGLDINESLYAKFIEGTEGGEIDFTLNCPTSSATGVIEFPEFCFTNQEEVSVQVPNTENRCAMLDISPHDIILEKPVFLTLKITGMNIRKGDKVDFKMLNDGGDLIDVEYSRLIIDYDDLWALVIDAKIYQFSKYGFTSTVN